MAKHVGLPPSSPLQLLQDCEQKLKISLRKDHYKTLGVDKHAENTAIKKAYRELAKKNHPDKVSDDIKHIVEAGFGVCHWNPFPVSNQPIVSTLQDDFTLNRSPPQGCLPELVS